MCESTQAIENLDDILANVPGIGFMRIEGRESWKLSLTLAVCLTAALYGIFDQVLHVAWPSCLLDQWLAGASASGG